MDEPKLCETMIKMEINDESCDKGCFLKTGLDSEHFEAFELSINDEFTNPRNLKETFSENSMGISMIVDEIIKVSALLVEERRKKDVVEKRIDELEQNLASLKQQLQNDFEEGKKKNEEEVEARIEAVRQEGKRKMKKKIANLKKKHRLMSDAGSRASGSGKPSFLSSTDKEESTNSSDSET